MFGDDVLPFVVVEVPVPRRNGFHTSSRSHKAKECVITKIMFEITKDYYKRLEFPFHKISGQ